jgi:alpha-L-fucosidase
MEPEQLQRMRELGMWLAKHGDTIYGTQEGPLPPQPWGALTRRGKRIYLHVLDSATTSLALPLPPPRIRSARYFADETELPFKDEAGTVTLQLRPEHRQELDRVVVLDTY